MNKGSAAAGGAIAPASAPRGVQRPGPGQAWEKAGQQDEQEEGLASNTSYTITTVLVPRMCLVASQAMPREGCWQCRALLRSGHLPQVQHEAHGGSAADPRGTEVKQPLG